jgi:hypothetical protein
MNMSTFQKLKQNWILVLAAVLAVSFYVINDYIGDRNLKQAVAKLEAADCAGEVISTSQTLVANDIDRQVYVTLEKVVTNPDAAAVFKAAAKAKAEIIESINVPNCRDEISTLKSLGLDVPTEAEAKVQDIKTLQRIDLRTGLPVRIKKQAPKSTPRPDTTLNPKKKSTPARPRTIVPGVIVIPPQASTPTQPKNQIQPSPEATADDPVAPVTTPPVTTPQVVIPPVTVPEIVVPLPQVTTPQVEVPGVITIPELKLPLKRKKAPISGGLGR